MSIFNRNRALEWLSTIITQELKKLELKDLTITTKATRIIGLFILSAVLDLIRRATNYRLDRIGEELSPEEEALAERYDNLEVEDVIQAYRDLEDRYLLTVADDESLFSELARHIEMGVLPTSRHLAETLLTEFSDILAWEDLPSAFISLYIKLLTKELLEESLAILDYQSRKIIELDAKNAVKMREDLDV